MAFNNTTLSSAVTTTDKSIVVANASGFVAGALIRIDNEFMQVTQGYISGTTIPVLRGRDGTVTAAHVSGAVVNEGLASDFATAPAGSPLAVVNPIFWPSNTIYSYASSGAITPVAGIHKLVGTSTLTMTLANPTKDQDGTFLIVIGDGKSQSTLALPSATGANTAGSSYDVFTFQNAGQVMLMFMAMNGAWCLPNFLTGTVTALTAGIA